MDRHTYILDGSAFEECYNRALTALAEKEPSCNKTNYYFAPGKSEFRNALAINGLMTFGIVNGAI